MIFSLSCTRRYTCSSQQENSSSSSYIFIFRFFTFYACTYEYVKFEMPRLKRDEPISRVMQGHGCDSRGSIIFDQFVHTRS